MNFMDSYLLRKKEYVVDFKFPEEFVEIISSKRSTDFEPWWFLVEYPDEVNDWLEILQDDLPTLQLIPFAKKGSYPEVACFDGHDRSGNPAILLVEGEDSPHYQICRSFKTFSDWVKFAKEDYRIWRSMGSKSR